MTALPTATEFAEPLGQGVYLVDTRIGGETGTTCCYVILGDRPALIETGPSVSASRVISALTALGVGPDDLATIAVTHVHLDHAGGVGDVAQAFPRAEVVVHPVGARHLVDPSRLMSSARRVYGHVLDDLFGPLAPTPSERVAVAEDGHVVRLGADRSLIMRYSPGHARHHAVFLDECTGDLYTGDAAGMYVPEIDTYKPTTPPPEFDFHSTLASLRLMRSMRPSRLLFSHFGPGPSADDGLTAAEAEIRFWVDQTRRAHSDRVSADRVVAQVRAAAERRYDAFAQTEVHHKWEELSSTDANVGGILRWLETRGKYL